MRGPSSRLLLRGELALCCSDRWQLIIRPLRINFFVVSMLERCSMGSGALIYDGGCILPVDRAWAFEV